MKKDLENKKAGRPADMNLCVLHKETGEKGTVGVGWKNEDGSISINLNSHVVLKQDKAESLRLFPKTEYPMQGTKSQRVTSLGNNYSHVKKKESFDDGEDDVPF